MNKSRHSAELHGRFSRVDELDLPAEALAQAGATIKKNLEASGYGE